MNRNQEAYFSELPSVELSRSTFDRSFENILTFNAGQLIPFCVDEVLPGDTFNVTTSKVVRLQTLLSPIFGNIYLDVYWFFVPNRLVWDHWRNFMGENTDSAWLDSVEYSVPQINVCQNYWYTDEEHQTDYVGAVEGSIYDYMGIPINIKNVSSDPSVYDGLMINALPIRGYAMIWNEFFRDENIMDPVNIYTGDATKRPKGDEDSYPIPADGETNMKPWPVSRYHDYFSSCLPAPQKGPDVMIPFDPLVPVGTADAHKPIRTTPFSEVTSIADSLQWSNIDQISGATGTNTYSVQTSTKTLNLADNGNVVYPVNLWANMDAMTVSTINNLRLAFQVQKLYEKDARGGTRYIEMLRSHFGVVSSDARLQRPEYLGGNRVPLNINQVTNNAQSEQDFLGDLGAMSHTVDVHSDFVKSFEEHGFVFGLCCVRYDHVYTQGLERMWSRKNRFDYYWPVFANIGEQPVYRRQIYANGIDNISNDKAVFGYNEAWAEYRYKPSMACSEMRPQAAQSLASWNLADDYSGAPTLSYEWMIEPKDNIDRTLAVTSSVSNQIMLDIYVENYCTRCMPVHSIPGLADHH